MLLGCVGMFCYNLYFKQSTLTCRWDDMWDEAVRLSPSRGSYVSVQQTMSQLHLCILCIYCIPEQVISCSLESINLRLNTERICQRGEIHCRWTFICFSFFFSRIDGCHSVYLNRPTSMSEYFGRSFDCSQELIIQYSTVFFLQYGSQFISHRLFFSNGVPFICDTNPINLF